MPDVTPRAPSRPLRWSDAVLDLQALVADVDQSAYLVGGVVRDTLLGRPTKDVDIVADGGIRLARTIANRMGGDFFALDVERDVGRALIDTREGRLLIDVAHYRGETLADDLLDRDFTMNAMAVDLHSDLSQLIDPLGGEQDAINRLLRRCNPDALRRDPIRALRAVRQTVQFGVRIERETKADVRAAAPHLYDTSPERVRDEFMKILALGRAPQALAVADALGLLAVIVPETSALHDQVLAPPNAFDGWQHARAVVNALIGILGVISPTRTDESGAQFSMGMIVMALDRFRHPLQEHIAQTYPEGRTHRALLVLAALLHETGSADGDENPGAAAIAAARAQSLRLANAERACLVAVTRHLLRPQRLADLSPLSIHRFWRATGDAGIDVCLLALADYLGTYGPSLPQNGWIAFLERIRVLLEAYFERYDQLVQPPVLVDGNQLIRALNLRQGPVVGKLLDLVREAQVTGAVVTADDAFALARNYVRANG